MNNPVQNFMTMYSPLGIYQGSVPRTFQTVLPQGMVPNLDYPVNAKGMQGGTPFTSEINMQFGTIYAGVKLFPTSITDALARPKNGYRLGLDVLDNNIAKFFIGSKDNFMWWDGTKLLLNGQLRAYGFNNAIEFYDQNQVFQGSMQGVNIPDPGILLQAVNWFIIQAGQSIALDAIENIFVRPDLNLSILSGLDTFIDSTAGDVTLFLSSIPFLKLDRASDTVLFGKPLGLVSLASDPGTGYDGEMWYNSTTNEVKVVVGGVIKVVQVV